MPGETTPQEFVAKWSRSELKESASSQEHFIDLCRMLGHGTPAEMDSDGTWFTFEYGATKLSGGEGWADVWKKGHFGWEYKGKDRSLQKAYDQLLQYRQSLQNPPLLIVSDINRIVIHTNFTNSVKREYLLTLDDLLDPEARNRLWLAFNDPEQLRDPVTAERVTEEAAKKFGELAEIMASWGEDPQKIAHFLIQILFCLFAEDIGIIPRDLFTNLLSRDISVTTDLTEPLSALFEAMSEGKWFGEHKIAFIDGGLFQGGNVLELPGDAIEILRTVSKLDWSSMEPAVFGTLFERSLDPSKRSQLGAHYTSREDIELVIEPVLMAPLGAKWKSRKDKYISLREEAISIEQDDVREKLIAEAQVTLLSFFSEIRDVQVLDPACGSGNFLYVSLAKLLDLQKEIIGELKTLGMTELVPTVNPEQLHGIEINAYAHELAEATIWMGYIQWMHQNGYGIPDEPILKPIDSVANLDAIIKIDSGQIAEPEWPEVFAIIGNPPYLGSQKMIRELGEDYVAGLRELYSDRLPGQSDLVCYWFEQARAQIEEGKAKRAGLLATQGIRGGANRMVLERIKDTGDIFWAESDRNWILEGASVNVSMVGFDNGAQETKVLDGEQVAEINPDLTSGIDLTSAFPLSENSGLAYQGPVKVGPFDIDEKLAKRMLEEKNPNALDNSKVVLPWIGAYDITRDPRNKWIIDFGDMNLDEASNYEAPFEYVRETVKPTRQTNRRKRRRERWWQHGETVPGLRSAVEGLSRFICTPRVSKHRVFVWVNPNVLPASGVVAIARDDDYFMGVMSSRIHRLWALRLGTHLEDRPRYTPTSAFETFPLPWPPGSEPQDNSKYFEIATISKELMEKKESWLFSEDQNERTRRRTLGKLYTSWPTWLEIAHLRLDEVVFDAYGWDPELSDSAILASLLKLNLERAGQE